LPRSLNLHLIGYFFAKFFLHGKKRRFAPLALRRAGSGRGRSVAGEMTFVRSASEGAASVLGHIEILPMQNSLNLSSFVAVFTSASSAQAQTSQPTKKDKRPAVSSTFVPDGPSLKGRLIVSTDSWLKIAGGS